MVPVARSLERAGCMTMFSTWGDPSRYLLTAGFACRSTSCLDLTWDPIRGFPGLGVVVRDLPRMLRAFSRQVSEEVRGMRSFGADVVLSDSRLSAVAASAILGIPSVVVLNQLRMLLPPENRRWWTSLAEDIDGEVLASLWSLGGQILIPDLPPPFTISEENLRGIRSAAERTRYVGFITGTPNVNAERLGRLRASLRLDDAKPLILAQISGPTATKPHLINTLLSPELDDSEFTLIVSGGFPGGRTEPKRIRNKYYYEWCPVRDELFSLASVLVSRGGHSTISQAALMGKPVILVPIPRHSEQIGNARKVAKLGAGLMLNQENLDPSLLSTAFSQVINDSAFRENANKLRGEALRHDGAAEVTRTVMQLAGVHPSKGEALQPPQVS